MTTILEAKDVNKSVAIGENEEHNILKDINLQLKKGGICFHHGAIWLRQVYLTVQHKWYGSD